MPAHIYAYMPVYVCLWSCVRGSLCAPSLSSCCRESAAAAFEKEAAHNYKFQFGGAQREGRVWTGRWRRRLFIVNSWAFTVDGQLCVCDGTCGWRKLSHNYTLLSVQPIILLRRERGGPLGESFVIGDGRGFQTERRTGWNQVHINQCAIWRTHTHTHTYIHTHIHTYSTLKYTSVPLLTFKENLWGLRTLTFTSRDRPGPRYCWYIWTYFSLCFLF